MHGLKAGGEVLWLRTNASGVIQRRVFSSAGCFVSSPKLRRRVALSLCGRDKGDGGIGTMRASASAPGALRRPRLGGRGQFYPRRRRRQTFVGWW